MNVIKLGMLLKFAGQNLLMSFSGFGITVLIAAASFIEPFTVNLIAGATAFAGAGCRWVYYSLDKRSGLAGMMICPFFAFCFAAFHPVFLDNVMHTVNDENYSLMVGATVGIFPTVVFGFFQDILGSMKALGGSGAVQGFLGLFKKGGGRA